MIRDAGRENLRLVLQPAKSARMDDAVAIALEFIAVRMGELGIASAAARRNGEPQTGQPAHLQGISLASLMAVLLIGPRGLLRKGMSSLQARCASLLASNSPSASVASSLETSTVG